MSEPVNKWNQPESAPPPMFFGKKERDLVKQVNDELAERVVGQTVAYYPVSLEDSNYHPLYGEAVDKVTLPPVRVYAYVTVENEQTNERYGYEYQTKLTVNFNRKRITDDQNLFVRVGDFLQYGDEFYEIVRTYNDTRYYFGQVEHKFQISAECVKARKGTFRVRGEMTKQLELGTITTASAALPLPSPPPAVPFAPSNAQYIVLSTDANLTQERVLTAGSGITLTDGGAGGAITIASTAAGTAGGIFTQVNSSRAYTTSSVTLGSSATPTHTVTVPGSISGSGALIVVGATTLGSTLNVTGALTLAATGSLSSINMTGTLSGSSTARFGSSVSSSGDLAVTGNVHATAYYGDGANLTNVGTSGSARHYSTTGFETSGYLKVSGSTTLAATASVSSVKMTGSLSGSSTAVFGSSVSSSGDVAVTGNIHATTYYGDGSNLTGVDSVSGSARQYSSTGMETSGYLKASGSVTFAGTGSFSSVNMTGSLSGSGTSRFGGSISSSGDLAVTGNVHATTYYGGGSNLTGISADRVDVTSSTGDIAYPIVFTEGFQTNGTLGLGGNANLIYNPNDSLLSSSAGLQAVGASIFGGTLAVSGATTLAATASVSSVNMTGTLSGSSTARFGGSISSSGDLAVTGNVHAAALYGDGSNLTGLPGGANSYVQFNNAGALGGDANFTYNGSLVHVGANLRIYGNTILGDSSADTVTLNGVAAGTSNTVLILDGSDLIKTDSIDSRVWGATLVDATGTPADNQVGVWTDANTMEGSSALTFNGSLLSSSAGAQFVGSSVFGGTVGISGATTLAATASASSINMTGTLSASHTAVFGSSISSSGDVAVTGNVHATTYYGDGSNLTGVDAVSGTARQYSSTGMETSGYLKASGSVTFAGTGSFSSVNMTGSLSGSGTARFGGSVSSSGDVAVTGNVHATTYYGDGSNLTGVDAVSGTARQYSSTGMETSGYLKASGSVTFAGTGSFSSVNMTGSLSGSGTARFGGSVSSSGDLAVTGNVHGAAFYGNGSGLTNISADKIDVTSSTGDINYPIVFTEGFQTNGTLGLGGNTALVYNPNDAVVSSSAGVQAVGPSVFGGTLAVSGATTLAATASVSSVVATGSISGSSTLQAVGATTLGSTLNVSGNTIIATSASVGTTSPSAQLHVSGAQKEVLFRVDGLPTGTGNTGTWLLLTGSRGADGAAGASLGIGTNDPQYALDVNGYISIGRSGGAYIMINDDADTWIRFGHAGSDSMQFRAGGLNFLEFDENGLDIARINPDGVDIDFQVATLNNDYTIFAEGSTDRVGIGTQTPSHTLTIAGAVSGSGVLQAVGNTVFGGQMAVSGGVQYQVTTVTSNTHLTASNATMYQVVSGGTATITMILPSASVANNYQYAIKRHALMSGSVVITGSDHSNVIDGNANVTLTSPGASLFLISDGNQWNIF